MVNYNNTICCLNPYCKSPENSDGVNICSSCGTPITILRNHYRPIKLLSDEGGFGRTYLAQDLDKLKEICVIKQLAPQQQGTVGLDKAKESFEGEAKQLQQLGEHPQIPRLLAYFEENGYLYLVQQYIRGRTLDKLPKQGCWNEQEVKDFLNGILPVLEVIHPPYNYANLVLDQTLTGHSDNVDSVAFSRDGKYLASGSWDKIIKTGREINTLSGHSEWVSSVAFSLDGKYLASGSGDKTIKIWRVR